MSILLSILLWILAIAGSLLLVVLLLPLQARAQGAYLDGRPGGRGRILRDRHVMLHLVRRFVGLFHIRGTIQGEVGLDDPADTAWLRMLAQLAAARIPGLKLSLRFDFTGEILQISGNLRSWLWPAQVVVVAVGQLFRRDVRQLLRATS